MLAALLMIGTGFAAVDEACRDVALAGPPDDYSEVTQNNFLLNYYALATTFSALHAPIPHKPGTGSIGLELSILPPLGCEQRLVLAYEKTEDTNKTPILPRPRGSFAFPAFTDKKGRSLVPYGGFGYVPHVPIGGTRNVMLSVEAGAGYGNLKQGGMQYGLRYHATLQRTVGEIATPFVTEEEAFDSCMLDGGEETECRESAVEAATPYDDVYIGSTFGVDLSAGYSIKKARFPMTVYGSVGFTDVTTFFYIDDDAVVSNNYAPYAGPTFSLGWQGSPMKKLDVAAEFYTAPFSLFDIDGFKFSSKDGSIYTGKFKIAYLF